MRLLINAASANMGGSVAYLRNVLRWVAEVAPEDAFVVVLPEATRVTLAEEIDAPNVEWMAFPHANTGGLARLRFDQIEIPRLLRRLHADVLYSSTGFGTFRSPRPQALLVRNTAYFDPLFQAKYRALGRSLRRTTIRRQHSLFSMRAADLVLFPTRAIHDLTARYLPLPERKTRVLHYGFDHENAELHRNDASPWSDRVAAWKAEDYRILLNVSTFAVHKNIETLVEALPLLAAAGHRVKLLTTTSRDRTADKAEYDAMQARIAALGVEGEVVELGYQSHAQLPALYREADLYVFPSFTESFGHSLVEAMAAGLPIVASGTPVNREVCGEAGRFFETFDAASCAETIGRVLGDDTERARMAIASRERAADFSWRGYVEELMELLRGLTRG